MNGPYIFCHMTSFLDGKIIGEYMSTPEGNAAGDVFYNISFGKSPYYKHQVWLSGRVLKRLFGIETLMLGGGGVLNRLLIQVGMCDEISVVIVAAADGSQDAVLLRKQKIALVWVSKFSWNL